MACNQCHNDYLNSCCAEGEVKNDLIPLPTVFSSLKILKPKLMNTNCDVVVSYCVVNLPSSEEMLCIPKFPWNLVLRKREKDFGIILFWKLRTTGMSGNSYLTSLFIRKSFLLQFMLKIIRNNKFHLYY